MAEAMPVAQEGTHVLAGKGTGAHSLTRAAGSKQSPAKKRTMKTPASGSDAKAAGRVKTSGRVKASDRVKAVSYEGYTFSVPAGWPVYRLGRKSTRCVRYDASAVYLGKPGENQQCPAQLIGQADTVSIASSGSVSQGRPVIDLQSAEVGGQVTAPTDPHPGLSVTATYGSDPDAVKQLLRSVRDTSTHAPVAIHQSAVTPPAAPSVVPAPSAVAPSAVVPSAVAPSAVVPSAVVPSAVVPPAATPSAAEQSAAVPAGAVPAGAVPAGAAGTSPKHAASSAKAARRPAQTPWERAWIGRALRWYPAGWYSRGRAKYMGARAWSPAGWYPRAERASVSQAASPAPTSGAPAPGTAAPVGPAPAGPVSASPASTTPATATSAPTGKGQTPKPSSDPSPSAKPTPKTSPKPSSKPSPKPSSKPSHSGVPTTHLKAPSTPLPGFDTCTAPSVQAMRAWRKSFSAAAIYIGGAEMACDYGNLSASWVKAVKAMGWSLIPLYVGLQAPCNSFKQEIQPGHAAAEGKSAAQAAVLDAKSFGLGTGTPIYFDMEAYNSGSSSCRDSVLSFLNRWTRKLHNLHYISGVYSSAASGAENLGNATSVYGNTMAKPDAMWFALWDNRANLLGMPYLLNTWWNPGRRIKQYEGSHWVKVNGVKLNIDSDWVQGPVY
jgi:hypothetical protein